MKNGKVRRCPVCESTYVTTAHIQMFYVNSGEHYLHITKTYDADSPALCIDCNWEGQRKDLIGEDE